MPGNPKEIVGPKIHKNQYMALAQLLGAKMKKLTAELMSWIF